MPSQEILVLAMTRMLSGICTAGFTCKPDAPTDLCWVRPVRDFDTVLPGDIWRDSTLRPSTSPLASADDGRTSTGNSSTPFT